MEKHLAYFTHEDSEVGHLYYFAPADRAPGPYLKQIHVNAIIDIAADGTLGGVELIDGMPPPPVASPDFDLFDLVAEALDNSMDVDWSSSVGARYVVEALEAVGINDASIRHPVVAATEAELEALPTHPLAAWRGGLSLGLHRVFWKDGGSSLCAIGMSSDGRRWFAPCNWVAPSVDPEADFWANIDRTELIAGYPEASDD